MSCVLAVDANGETAIVKATGEIDLVSTAAFAETLERATHASNAAVVIDLTAVSLIDSSALHALLRAHAAADEMGRPLAIVCRGGAVRRVFEITGLDEMLTLIPANVPEAV